MFPIVILTASLCGQDFPHGQLVKAPNLLTLSQAGGAQAPKPPTTMKLPSPADLAKISPALPTLPSTGDSNITWVNNHGGGTTPLVTLPPAPTPLPTLSNPLPDGSLNSMLPNHVPINSGTPPKTPLPVMPKIEPSQTMVLPVAGTTMMSVDKNTIVNAENLSLQKMMTPQTATDFTKRAQIYLNRLDFISADFDLQRARNMAPGDAAIWALSGEVAFRRKQLADAKNYVTIALKYDAQNAVAHRIQAALAYDVDDYDSALRDATNAIRCDPKEARNYLGRGMIYAARGEFEKAYADYTTAIQLQPHNPDFYWHRAGLSLHMHDPIDAEMDAEIGLIYDPEHRELNFIRGKLFHWRDDIGNMTLCMNIALRGRARGQLEHTVWGVSDRKFQADVLCEAISWFIDTYTPEELLGYANQVETFDPNRGENLSNRAALYERMGKADEAFAEAKKAVEKDPKCGHAHFNYGRMLAARNSPEARGEMETALCLNPERPHHYRVLGFWQLRHGQVREALDLFTTGLTHDPMLLDLHEGAALAYARLGRQELALFHANIVVLKAPKNPMAYYLRAKVHFWHADWPAMLADLSECHELQQPKE
jgi:tetratricopeptide (TPR) repeat protein